MPKEQPILVRIIEHGRIMARAHPFNSGRRRIDRHQEQGHEAIALLRIRSQVAVQILDDGGQASGPAGPHTQKGPGSNPGLVKTPAAQALLDPLTVRQNRAVFVDLDGRDQRVRSVTRTGKETHHHPCTHRLFLRQKPHFGQRVQQLVRAGQHNVGGA